MREKDDKAYAQIAALFGVSQSVAWRSVNTS